MKVPILLLAMLLGSFLLISGLSRRKDGYSLSLSLRGRLSLALLFIFTGICHFTLSEQMVQMLPPDLPERLSIVYSTGLLEFLGALGLLTPGYTRIAGTCFIIFLIAVFPANIYAAWQRIPIGGHEIGPMYLVIRIPLQLFLIWWTYYFALATNPRPPKVNSKS